MNAGGLVALLVPDRVLRRAARLWLAHGRRRRHCADCGWAVRTLLAAGRGVPR